MTDLQKASMNYAKNAPDSDELYDGFTEGAKWQKEEYENEEAKTERNAITVSSFVQHCKELGIEISDSIFESYFNA